MYPDGGRTGGPWSDPGLYRRFHAIDGPHRPAIFLDRDGVVVEEVGYLHRPEDVSFVSGAIDAIAAFNRSGLLVVLVTNQSGIARGLYGWNEFEAVQQRIENTLEHHGAWIDGVWACAYHSSGSPELTHPNHAFRKPNPGMIVDAIRMMPIDAGKSWLIGDKVDDMEAAIRGGLSGAIHVLTGHGAEHRPHLPDLQSRFPDADLKTANSIRDAATMLLSMQI
jgi:D-glycero-D-manno-heptose 1,7-bisphosphate phosphatase